MQANLIFQEINTRFAEFFKIGNDYLKNIGKSENSIPVEKKEIITKEIPKLLYDILDSKKYFIKGSVGKGRLSRTPWIAIMNMEITTTTQKGVYVVFLFSSKLDKVYLTIGQGTTEEGQFGKRTKVDSIIEKRNLLRKELSDIAVGLQAKDSIDVADEGYKNCVLYADEWNMDSVEACAEQFKYCFSFYDHFTERYKEESSIIPQILRGNTHEVSFEDLIIIFKSELPELWKLEKYKWEAVKYFQKHWDIDADDFGSMFAEATSKHVNLLGSGNYFPLGMIAEYAAADKERTREMFKLLFDESMDIVDRVEFFMQEAEEFRLTNSEKWNNHYQDLRAITTYLTFRFPEKYYIYKYTELKKSVELFNLDFSFKAKSEASFIVSFNKLMDQLNSQILDDAELCELVDGLLNKDSSCYKDELKHILTVDFVFYIGKRYVPGLKDKDENSNQSLTYWILPGNNNKFKVIEAFRQRDQVDWKQGNYKFKAGDICFIYCSDEYQKILFKTIIEQVDIDSSDYLNDIAFWVDQNAFEERSQQNKYIRLKRIKALDPSDDRLSINILKSLGLNGNIQGPMKVPTVKMLDTINAVFEDTNNTIMIKKEVSPNSRYWIYAPGDRANRWVACQNNGLMSLGWEEMGDISQYKTREEMLPNLKLNYGDGGTHKNDSLALWQFCHDMKPGDVIYAKSGRNAIVGRGIVQSNYRFDASFEDHNNVCDVQWTHTGNWDAPFVLPLKTLTRIGTSAEDKKLIDSLEALSQRIRRLIKFYSR